MLHFSVVILVGSGIIDCVFVQEIVSIHYLLLLLFCVYCSFVGYIYVLIWQ